MKDIAMQPKEALTSEQKAPITYTQPLTNIFKSGDVIVLEVSMPGISKEDISLQAEKGNLIVEGRQSEKPQALKVHKKEFGRSTYKRSFVLPEDVDQSLITASSEQGVLTILLPKKEAAKKKTISIQ